MVDTYPLLGKSTIRVVKWLNLHLKHFQFLCMFLYFHPLRGAPELHFNTVFIALAQNCMCVLFHSFHSVDFAEVHPYVL